MAEAKSDPLQPVMTWATRGEALSRFPWLVVSFGVFAILAAIAVGWVPGVLKAATATDEAIKLVFSGVAIALAFLLLLYGITFIGRQEAEERLESRKAGPTAAGAPEVDEADAFVLYSPPGFVDDLKTHLEKGRVGWGQRALYVGVDGARSWLRVSEHEDYDINERKLRSALASVMAWVTGPLGSLVSLGPGDGRVDVALMSLLGGKGARPSYVPIDISEGLLLLTMKRLRKEHADAHMPFGILGDFEYGWDAFRHLLAGQARPRLFSILGNTVSNLDAGLQKFFPTFWSGVGENDYVLFDVLLGDFDDRLQASESGTYDPNLLFPDTEVMGLYKAFIGYGARRVSMDHRVYDEELGKLTRWLEVHRSKEPVDGYDQLHLQYHGNGENRTIFKWRRYRDTANLENWLSANLQGCQVLGHVDVTDDGLTTRLILLRRNAASPA